MDFMSIKSSLEGLPHPARYVLRREDSGDKRESPTGLGHDLKGKSMAVYIEEDELAYCMECFETLAGAVYVSAMKPDMPICFNCFVLALLGPVKVNAGLATEIVQ
jgi:hypothetical protein